MDAASLYDELLWGLGRCSAGSSAGRDSRLSSLRRDASSDRDAMRASSRQRGIQTGIHYAVPLHLEPAFSDLGYSLGRVSGCGARSEVDGVPADVPVHHSGGSRTCRRGRGGGARWLTFATDARYARTGPRPALSLVGHGASSTLLWRCSLSPSAAIDVIGSAVAGLLASEPAPAAGRVADPPRVPGPALFRQVSVWARTLSPSPSTSSGRWSMATTRNPPELRREPDHRALPMISRAIPGRSRLEHDPTSHAAWGAAQTD